MNNFTFQYPVKQYFGKGILGESLKTELPNMGETIMIAYGGGSLKRSGLYDRIRNILEESGKHVVDFGGIMPNPTYAKVKEGAQVAKENNVDFILAVGGGSVIDCCKIISAQSQTDEDIWDMLYTEKRVPTKSLPIGAIVTASGTGAEQNNGAVITNEDKKLKQPLFGAYHRFAVLDSDLTLTLPMKQVISGAFDTLSHCMETYMGQPVADNVSDEINETIMRNVIKNLRAIIANPADDFARGELMWDSAMAENGMLKLGKVTDFQCHMLEHAVGAYTNCNHGQGLAIIHPALYRHYLPEGIEKLAKMARNVWGVAETDDALAAKAGIEALEAFIKEIGLPAHWNEIGVTDEGILRESAYATILPAGCCKRFSHEELFEVLKETM
jgi:Uncharacterized oxidoreductases, Fe-dependent alcohol dehydrogenase family